MKRVFATVGTTSFDDFTQSLCSLHFLTAMAHHHHEVVETSLQSVSLHSSMHLPSASLSSSDVSVHGHSQSSSLTSSSLSSSVELSSTQSSYYDIVLIIQYGKGICPLTFIPSSLVINEGQNVQNKNDDNDDGSGSVMICIPIDKSLISTDNNDDDTQNTNTKQQQYCNIRIQWYRFLPSLSAEMERADIILCHAGAGTLLEALSISEESTKSIKGKIQRKIINAVINTKLMDNHQTELAEELEKRKHICVTRDCISEWTTDDKATQFWNNMRVFSPLPFYSAHANQKRPVNNISSFQRIVDHVMGFSEVMNTKKTH